MVAFIYDHVRSPRGRGRAGGSLHEITAIQLAAQTLAAIEQRNHLDTALLDDIVLGCAQPVGEQGGDIARSALLVAGYSETVPGLQLHRFCASGLEALNVAAAKVMAGQALAMVAGGVESMSRTSIGADAGAWTSDPQTAYQCNFVPQGIGADLIATLDGFTREDVDRYALQSQKRAAHASSAGYFTKSLASVRDVLGRVVLDQDENLRPNTTLEGLAKLKPAFSALGEQGFDAIALHKYPHVEAINHVHTGGNSSGIVDGAAAVLIGSKEFGVRAGLKPRARIRGFASLGSEPSIMLTAPAPATRKLLQQCGMKVSDIDLFEVNEAFASVVLRFQRELDLDGEQVNVNGGAIALGHPLGATGAILVGSAVDELERRNVSTALITLCAGNGMGTATVIERV